jgi:hypothetical protein
MVTRAFGDYDYKSRTATDSTDDGSTAKDDGSTAVAVMGSKAAESSEGSTAAGSGEGAHPPMSAIHGVSDEYTCGPVIAEPELQVRRICICLGFYTA